MFLVSSCSCLRPVHWSHVLSQEWRCIWSYAYMGCTNYIWVINKVIACKGVSYIRGFRVHRLLLWSSSIDNSSNWMKNGPVPSELQNWQVYIFNIEARTKGPTLSRQHFEAHFLDSKCSYFGSCKGLLPDGTKPWPEPKSVYHQRGPMTFIRR